MCLPSKRKRIHFADERVRRSSFLAQTLAEKRTLTEKSIQATDSLWSIIGTTDHRPEGDRT